MQYIFSAANQALLAAGKLVQVYTKDGQLLPILRDPETGRFVEIAKVLVGTSAEPFLAPIELLMDTAQMVQTHMGFQETYRRIDLVQTSLNTLQNSMVVLQSTTALIGIGTVAAVVLSAVNLHQTLKLRQDVKQLRLEVKDGFIDLKEALKDQGKEILSRIDQVARDVEFNNQRTILVRAYGRFEKALKRLQTALTSQDLNFRNSEINGVRQMLFEALADYDNSQLLMGTCSAGQLRRQECVWAIEQAIITTYQLQGQSETLSHALLQLQDKIRKDALNVIDRCQSQEELDFLFPEIARIQSQDLPVLQAWQDRVDWMQSLSKEELKQLNNAEFNNTEIPTSQERGENESVVPEPPEQLLYEKLQQKSHYLSLRDQLRFLIAPDLRRNYEEFISEQAVKSGNKGLAPSNWQEIPDLTVANLYWYFKKA